MFLADIPVEMPDTPPTHMEYQVSEEEARLKRDKLTSNLYTFSSKLKNPASWCSSYVHRILSPMLIGEYDFSDTTEKELLARFFHSLKLFGIGPISVPLAGLGVGIRCLGTYSQLYSYCLVYGNKKEEKNLHKAKVMSWNVAGIGWGMERSRAGVLEWEKRADSIIQKIIDVDPDILCLQEVFDTDFCNKLIEGLKHEYATFYTHMGKVSFIGSNSGLFVASKVPIEDFKFTEFQAKTNKSKWQKKGFASFLVYSNNKPKLQIIATHLQHGEDGAKARQNQLNEILSSKLNQDIPILLVGDLNIEWESNEYKNTPLSSHFHHAYSYNLPTCTNFLTKYLWKASRKERKNGINSDDEYIDYFSFLKKDPKSNKKIFYPKTRVYSTKAYDLNNPSASLSDHNALVGTVPL